LVRTAASTKGAIIEDCTVDGLKTGGLLHLDGCAFKHVVVRGAVGRVLLTNSPLVSPWLSREAADLRVSRTNLNGVVSVEFQPISKKTSPDCWRGRVLLPCLDLRGQE
jgi:hypothetical protein